MDSVSPMRLCVLCDEKHVNSNDTANVVMFGDQYADRACVTSGKYADEVEELQREWTEE